MLLKVSTEKIPIEQTAKTAVIVPVHPPKLADFTRLVESYHKAKPDIDLYAVIEDAKDEIDHYRALLPENRIICAPSYENDTSPITRKKFFGLDALTRRNGYLGIMTMDADSLFITQNPGQKRLTGGFTESFRVFFRDGLVYTHEMCCHKEVMAASCSYVPDNKYVAELRGLFPWWNSLPWYHNIDIETFLKDIGFDKHHFVGQNWHAFDHIIYLSWLIQSGRARLSPKHFYLESPDVMSEAEIANLTQVPIDWIPYPHRDFPGFATATPLLYNHTDRNPR